MRALDGDGKMMCMDVKRCAIVANVQNFVSCQREVPMGHKTRIMYIERKAGQLTGTARIGRVTYSKTGATIYYRGRQFQSLKGSGFKANYYEVDTGEEYWISGPRKDGCDALYATNVQAEIDEDVADEYWTKIRKRSSSSS
jgi:hypothetical protein